MLLKRLELQGFKSFATRATLEFGPGITALVGPNGSGKSNVADAIRWVLGEQSARLLRGKRAEEVIFGGGVGRAPLGLAEVALVLDNHGGRLPIDFGEVRLVRRIHRSGESEYLINGARARRKDLVELLLGLGLQTGGYTVIGQGAVEELVLQKAEERRAVLEQAAGISQHQVRLAEARGRLGATEQNLTRCSDLVAELEPLARRLRAQAERADRYQARRQELVGVASAYYRAALGEAQALLDRAEADLAYVDARTEKLQADVQAGESMRASSRSQMEALEHALAALRDQREQALADRERRLSALAQSRQRLGFLEARWESLQGDARRIDEQYQQARSEQASAAAVDRANPPDRSELEALSELADGVSRQLRETRGRLEQLREALGQKARERQRLERAADQLRERERQVLQQAAAVQGRREALEAALLDLRERLANQEQTARSQETTLGHLSARVKESRAAESLARQRATDSRGRLQGAQAELQLAVAALAALEREHGETGRADDRRGVPLAAALSPPADLEPAVTSALGEWAAALVMDSGQQASLSAEAGRRLSVRTDFVGDEDLAAWRSSVEQALAGSSFRLMVDLLSRKTTAGVAALGPLLQTILVDDLTAARTAAARLSKAACTAWLVVTLDGQVLTSFGGYARGVETFAERLISKARRLAEARDRLEQIRSAVAATEQSHDMIQTALDEAEAGARALRERELELQAELRASATRLAELRRERERAEAELRRQPDAVSASSIRGELDGLGERIAQSDAAIYRSTQEAAALDEELRTLQAEWEKAWTAREQARLAVERAETSWQEARSASERRERALLQLEQDQSRLIAEREQVELERRQLTKAIDEEERLLLQAADRLDDLARRLEQSGDERRRQVAELRASESALATLRDERAATQPAREAALLARQRASSDLERLRAEAGILGEELGLNSGDGVVQLGLFASLEATPASTEPPPIDLGSARRRMLALQRELRAYGPVSGEVLEETREVESRLEFLTSQSADLRRAIAELDAVIQELEGLLEMGFTAAFERVNEAFAKTFATLFGGGTARLALTAPDDLLATGVEIVAQPPGKRLQSLTSLSGGERALTSTALIFALLGTNPLPFCVLDEVDAALDESNARRFADLLQQYSERTQFIIVTHNRATMEIASSLYGVSMGADGVSTLLSLRPSASSSRGQHERDHLGAEPVLQA
jgi:chromosome segregation protein